ncbi:hypothetical protein BV898_06456 [Hypsibius exemplaris]|uniref:Protein kinase domain-containing protein n=1 Tax=Hypsibius exemplaris TaxID=2072580 RepID=A0A1W0WW95_HYPEX|nr:hypothetical protein BV898_06456 [Hypsibius exemplaris]
MLELREWMEWDGRKYKMGMGGITGRIVLGRGAFGILYKGMANGLPTTTRQHRPVAVKALLNPFDPVQQHLFYEEISVMAKIGRDVNFVGLLGIVL